MDLLKNRKIWLLAFSLWLVVWGLIAGNKIMSQEENPMIFRFEDFQNQKDTEMSLNKKLPIGTPRSEVDNFFKTMGLEESTPWHLNVETERLEPNKGDAEYFVYYFKLNSKKKNQPLTGKYVKAFFSDEVLSQILDYGVITQEKGQGLADLMLILRKGNGHD